MNYIDDNLLENSLAEFAGVDFEEGFEERVMALLEKGEEKIADILVSFSQPWVLVAALFLVMLLSPFVIMELQEYQPHEISFEEIVEYNRSVGMKEFL